MPPPPVPAPPGAAAAMVVPANSVAGPASLVAHLEGADGTWLPWADAEPVLCPRFDVADRLIG
eukprot:6238396-Prymnesium_polylepis.1